MLVQMSGIPGTGKSTLAGALGEKLGLIVLDTDVVKSALLRTGVPLEQAGPATYAATIDVAAHLLAQGSSVVLDSPCRYPELLDAGQQIAADASVPYRLIELWVEDVASVLPRLEARTPRLSQVASASQPPEGAHWESGTRDRLIHSPPSRQFVALGSRATLSARSSCANCLLWCG